MSEDKLAVEERLAIRKEAAQRINPETAEFFWHYRRQFISSRS